MKTFTRQLARLLTILSLLLAGFVLTAAPKSAEATEYSTLSGTIVDAAGNPIPDLWVYCVWSDGRTATVMTDGDGNYTMHPPLATPLIGLNVSHRSLTLNYPQDNNEGSGPAYGWLDYKVRLPTNIGSRFDLTLPDFGLVTKTLHVQDAAGNPVANQQVVLGNQLAPFGWYVTVAIPTATGASIPATGTSQQLIGNTSLSAQVRLSTDWAKPSSASWTNPYVCITDGNGDCQVAGYPGQSYNIQVSLAEQPGFPIPSTVSATLDLATADTALSLTTRFFTYAQSRGNSQGNVLIQSPSGTSLAGLSIASGTGLGLPSEDQVLVGKVGYSVHDVALGGSIDMYFALPAGSLPNVIFQVTPAGTKDISNLATFSGDVVKLHLTDGGQGDEDGIANGIIVDPMVPVRRLAKAVSPAPTPTITGKAIMASTLVAKVGKWQRGATLSYFWMRNGAAITGASASSYVLTAADVGQQISVAVVGSVAGYRSVTIASTAVTPTAGALKAGKPAITGKAQVGQVLSANAGTWAPGVSLSYSWLRNGQAIFLALGSTYTLRAGDAGQQISVQVTAKLAGYVTAIVISKAVKAKA